MSPLQVNPESRARQTFLSRKRSWFLIALLFVIALVNYFDRQSLSVVAPRFQAILHLSDEGYGHVISLFLLASAFSYAVTGFIADWLGIRLTMALFVGWWSAAEAATAIVRSAAQLATARFCLGLGEPGLWVAAPKAVGEVLPKKDHAFAIGLYTLGSTVGAVIALPAIAAIVAHLPWKSVFLIDGCAGILCVPIWLAAYPSRKSRPVDDAPVSVAPAIPRSSAVTSLKEVLAQSKTWKFMIARGITDPVWYFYLFWFPKYMLSARGLTLAQVARIGWLVYMAAGVGTLLGGWLAGQFIRRGIQPSLAYRRTMLLCALLIPLSPLAGLVPSALLAVGIASVIAMAHMGWLVTLSSAIIDLYPSWRLGTAFGLIAAGSGFGGMVSTEIVGFVVMHHGYLPLFFLMMALHPAALLLVWNTLSQRAATAPAAA